MGKYTSISCGAKLVLGYFIAVLSLITNLLIF